MTDITFLTTDFFDRLAESKSKNVHLVLIATKPDIIKQVPLYKELKKRGHTAVLGHTGQHYDVNLSGGMLKEFGVEPDFNLNVRGAMHEVVSQIIHRLGWVIGEMKTRGLTVIPYVHGDTTTAMAGANAVYCHGFASVHVEAGIRTLTPNYKSFKLEALSDKHTYSSSLIAHSSWRSFLMDRSNWLRGSQEPYPEQFNTRCAEAGTGIHLAPVELVREFLTSEGYADDRIFVGNSVVDATEEALKQQAVSGKRLAIFDTYPMLEKGNFVRFCIHRRENCLSESRFRAIYGAMKSLIEDGRNVLLINMIQTNLALERFGLKAELEALAKTHKNFILSPVWPEYGDVIAVMNRASVCATDSGSMQEEMNVLGVPCVTLRFGSDRSESAINGGNLIAPPTDPALIKTMIEYAWDNAEMKNVPKIYGKNVSTQCVDAVEKVLKKGTVFRAEEERMRTLNYES